MLIRFESAPQERLANVVQAWLHGYSLYTFAHAVSSSVVGAVVLVVWLWHGVAWQCRWSGGVGVCGSESTAILWRWFRC